MRVFIIDKTIGLPEREILVLGVYIDSFKHPSCIASRQLLITQIATAGFTPPSPQPCTGWHGYRVTGAHHEDVGMSADGHAKAPPSRAAAAAPPAGATKRLNAVTPGCIFLK
jgi:hypothetical protein